MNHLKLKGLFNEIIRNSRAKRVLHMFEGLI